MESKNQKQTKEPLPLPTQIVLGLVLSGLAFFTYQMIRIRPTPVTSDDPSCLYWVDKVGANCKQTKIDQCERWEYELNKCLERAKLPKDQRKKREEEDESLRNKMDEWEKDRMRYPHGPMPAENPM